MSNKFYLKSDKADWVHKQQSLEIKSNFDNIIIKKNIIPFIDFNKKIHFLDFEDSYYSFFPIELDLALIIERHILIKKISIQNKTKNIKIFLNNYL